MSFTTFGTDLLTWAVMRDGVIFSSLYHLLYYAIFSCMTKDTLQRGPIVIETFWGEDIMRSLWARRYLTRLTGLLTIYYVSLFGSLMWYLLWIYCIVICILTHGLNRQCVLEPKSTISSLPVQSYIRSKWTYWQLASRDPNMLFL